MALQTPSYAALLQQIHSDLRIQHPEWIQPNGESPMCDSYEARLMELLDASIPRESNKSATVTIRPKRVAVRCTILSNWRLPREQTKSINSSIVTCIMWCRALGLTTELRDAGGPSRPCWRLTWSARIRSSKLVSLHHMT